MTPVSRSRPSQPAKLADGRDIEQWHSQRDKHIYFNGVVLCLVTLKSQEHEVGSHVVQVRREECVWFLLSRGSFFLSFQQMHHRSLLSKVIWI